jgi:uncharacterized protein (UPF0147 family)
MTPEWAKEPFRRFLDAIDRVVQVLHISIRGIAVLRGVPRAIEAIAKLDDADDTERDTKVEAAEAEAMLAQREVDEGFPLLHAQALVTTWSLLESLIKEFVTAWLRNHPDALLAQPVAKLKVPVSKFIGLSEVERCAFLTSLLENDLASSLRKGAGRFESLLGVFDLSGPLPPSLSRDLFELSELRNLIVHRRGIADARILESCPWLGLRLGEEVHVSSEQFTRLSTSASRYIVCLLVRVGERFGVDMSEFDEGDDSVA